MKFVPNDREKVVLYNDNKHDRVCKLVAEIKHHAKNFPNAPSKVSQCYIRVCRIKITDI